MKGGESFGEALGHTVPSLLHHRAKLQRSLHVTCPPPLSLKLFRVVAIVSSYNELEQCF